MKYFTIKQVAEDHLNVSTRTVYRLIADGELKRVYVRGSARIPQTSLANYTNRFEGGVK